MKSRFLTFYKLSAMLIKEIKAIYGKLLGQGETYSSI